VVPKQTFVKVSPNKEVENKLKSIINILGLYFRNVIFWGKLNWIWVFLIQLTDTQVLYPSPHHTHTLNSTFFIFGDLWPCILHLQRALIMLSPSLSSKQWLHRGLGFRFRFPLWLAYLAKEVGKRELSQRTASEKGCHMDINPPPLKWASSWRLTVVILASGAI
jgi:hypothetical protein